MLRDNTTRAKNAIIMLWISFAFLFIFLISDIFELYIIREFLVGEIDDELFARAELSDTFSGIVGILWLVIFIIMSILFLMCAYYKAQVIPFIHILLNFNFISKYRSYNTSQL